MKRAIVMVNDAKDLEIEWTRAKAEKRVRLRGVATVLMIWLPLILLAVCSEPKP